RDRCATPSGSRRRRRSTVWRLLASGSTPGTRDPPMSLRVVSYNLRSLRAGIAPAVEAVVAYEPDVLLVQEYGPPYRLRAFGKAMGMDWASSFAPFNRLRNAVLFRSPWRLVRSDHQRFSKTRGQYRRGFVLAELETKRAGVTAVSVH